MRFVINQKLLSIAGKYFIKDELGNDAFVVKGNFSFPRKYRVYDMQNNEIVRIKKRMFRLLPRFDYYKGDTMVCYAKRKFSFKPNMSFSASTCKSKARFSPTTTRLSATAS